MLLCSTEYSFFGAGTGKASFSFGRPVWRLSQINELLSLDNCDSRIRKQNIQATGRGISFCFLDSNVMDDQREFIHVQYM